MELLVCVFSQWPIWLMRTHPHWPITNEGPSVEQPSDTLLPQKDLSSTTSGIIGQWQGVGLCLGSNPTIFTWL